MYMCIRCREARTEAKLPELSNDNYMYQGVIEYYSLVHVSAIHNITPCMYMYLLLFSYAAFYCFVAFECVREDNFPLT